MCGRYVTPEEAAMERYWTIGRHNWERFIRPLFNVAPTTRVPVILRGEDGTLEGHEARGGLIPSWWKQPAPPSMTFNARSEEAAGKPMWRTALKSQRCLMPLRGWYEWQVVPGARAKQPYFIHVPGQEVLAFAAIWSRWAAAQGETTLSCALLTRDAAPVIAPIHHRMPVVLHREDFDEWLDPATPAERVQAMLQQSRTDFTGYPVSTMVNNARNDSPDLLREVPTAG
jgi:putative SOS response-associated peptidase YedK